MRFKIFVNKFYIFPFHYIENGCVCVCVCNFGCVVWIRSAYVQKQSISYDQLKALSFCRHNYWYFKHAFSIRLMNVKWIHTAKHRFQCVEEPTLFQSCDAKSMPKYFEGFSKFFMLFAKCLQKRREWTGENMKEGKQKLIIVTNDKKANAKNTEWMSRWTLLCWK